MSEPTAITKEELLDLPVGSVITAEAVLQHESEDFYRVGCRRFNAMYVLRLADHIQHRDGGVTVRFTATLHREHGWWRVARGDRSLDFEPDEFGKHTQNWKLVYRPAPETTVMRPALYFDGPNQRYVLVDQDGDVVVVKPGMPQIPWSGHKQLPPGFDPKSAFFIAFLHLPSGGLAQNVRLTLNNPDSPVVPPKEVEQRNG